jgi:AcrR family transcriptional regulator
MAGRPRTASDDDILAATARAIGKRGPARLTLGDVASEVGLSPAAIVQRFGSKRGLLLAFAARSTEAVDRVFDEAAEHHPAPLEALHAALARMVDGIDSPATLAHHLAFLQLDLIDDELHGYAVRQSRELRTRIRQLLDDAAVAGDLTADDTVALSANVYAAWSGAMITWAIDGEGRIHERIGRHVEALLAPYRHG